MSAMLDFFLSNKGMAEGKFQVVNGREALQKKWEELANDLNAIKGANKTVAQWQVVRKFVSVTIDPFCNTNASFGIFEYCINYKPRCVSFHDNALFTDMERLEKQNVTKGAENPSGKECYWQ